MKLLIIVGRHVIFESINNNCIYGCEVCLIRSKIGYSFIGVYVKKFELCVSEFLLEENCSQIYISPHDSINKSILNKLKFRNTNFIYQKQ